MRISGRVWFLALVIHSHGSLAQEANRPSSHQPWLSWLYGSKGIQASGTLIHESARSIAASDRKREIVRENLAIQQRLSAWKAESMRTLRIERERRVAGAVARAWTPPFDPPSQPVGAPPPLVATAISENKEEGSQLVDMTDPATVPRNRATPRPVAAVAAVDQIVQQVGGRIIGSAPSQALSPGLFALVLTGLFLVPAAGVSFVIFGIAQLRGHSFVSGSAMIVIAGILLWGTWTLARAVNPNILANEDPVGRSARQ